MTIEFRTGYTDSLGDMVYDQFLADPDIVKPPYVLLDRETTKQRLQNMAWICGAYDGNIPVAAWWGKDNEIQVVARTDYRKKWLSKGLLKSFFRWFFSLYGEAKAQARNDYAYKLLRKLGFNGNPKEMVKNG